MTEQPVHPSAAIANSGTAVASAVEERQPELALGTPFRLFVYVCFVLLALPMIDPFLFTIEFSGLPFSATDWVFFLLGGMGFVLVPKRRAAEAWSPGLILGWSAGLLLACATAEAKEVALKHAVAILLWGFSALGLARLMHDRRLRRAFFVTVLVIGARWALHVVLVYREIGSAEGTVFVGKVNHNSIGPLISMAAVGSFAYLTARARPLTQVVGLAILAIGLTVLSLTLSRESVLSLAVGTIVALVRFRRRAEGRIALVAVIAMIGVAIISSAQIAQSLGERNPMILQRFDVTDSDYQTRTSGMRRRLFEIAFDALTDVPGAFIGIGGGNVQVRTKNDPYVRGALSLHSEHLTVLVEGGILSFICWLALMRRTAFTSLRKYRLDPVDLGLVAAGTTYFFQLLFMNALGPTLWWLLAALGSVFAAAEFEARGSSDDSASERAALRRGADS